MQKFVNSHPVGQAAKETGASQIELMVARARGWTSIEMTKLAQGVKELTEDRQMDPEKQSFWETIASQYVTTKNAKLCQQRWKTMLKPRGFGTWSIEEDQKLRDQYPKCKEKWATYEIEGRDGDSIRARHRLLKNRGLF
jgi:hypothetical protein